MGGRVRHGYSMARIASCAAYGRASCHTCCAALLRPASCERAERSFCGAAACFAVMLRDAQCLGCSGSLPWLSASRAERRWLTEVHLRVKRHRRVLTGYSLLWGTHGVLSHRGSWLTEGHLRVERHRRVQPKRLVHDPAEQSRAEQSRACTHRSACRALPRWRTPGV